MLTTTPQGLLQKEIDLYFTYVYYYATKIQICFTFIGYVEKNPDLIVFSTG